MILYILSKCSDVKCVASVLFLYPLPLTFLHVICLFLAPSGTVQNLKAKQEGLNIHLSWESVSEQKQRGFIKGYNVSCSSAGGDEMQNVVISGK